MMLIVGKRFEVSGGNIFICFRNNVLWCVSVLFVGNIDVYKYISFFFGNKVGF